MPNAPNLIYAEAKRKPAYETQAQRVGWSAFLLMSSPSNEACGRQSLGNPSENSISDFLPRRPPRYPTIASRASRVASGLPSKVHYMDALIASTQYPKRIAFGRLLRD
jgi:hypothetical protein